MTSQATARAPSGPSPLREVMATYEEKRELVLLGAYRPGADRATDDALARIAAVENFLRQPRTTPTPFDDSRRALLALFE